MTRPPLLTLFEGPLSPGEAVTWNGTAELDLLWINEGGRGSGLALQLWGPAVNAKLVEPSSAAMLGGSRLREALVTEGTVGAGQRVFRAEAPWATIGAHAQWETSSTTAAEIGASMFTTRLSLRVLAAGKGRLFIAVLPTDGVEAMPLDIMVTTCV